MRKHVYVKCAKMRTYLLVLQQMRLRQRPSILLHLHMITVSVQKNGKSEQKNITYLCRRQPLLLWYRAESNILMQCRWSSPLQEMRRGIWKKELRKRPKKHFTEYLAAFHTIPLGHVSWWTLRVDPPGIGRLIVVHFSSRTAVVE